jgi:dihydrofolate reductase
MNEIPKAVFSRSGPSGARGDGDANTGVWDEAEVIGGDLAAGIDRLKKQEGKFLLAQGGIAFAQNLIATGLVDEYWLAIHPVALGNGLPLFNKLAQPLPLKLVESRMFATGAFWNAYQPA